MDNLFLFNGRTMFIGTTNSGFTFTSNCRKFAYRTCIRNCERHFRTSSFFWNYANNLWNDLGCLVNDDMVTNANILFIDEVLIMQCNTTYICTGYEYRFQFTSWSKNPRTPHIDSNILKNGLYLFWRIFVSCCPFRVLRSTAKYLLIIKTINLNYHTICIVWQLMALFTPIINSLYDLVNCFAYAVMRIYRKLERF